MIEPAGRGGRLPLSFARQRLWSPSPMASGPAAGDELDALLAGAEGLSDDEIGALPAAGLGEGGHG